jgi:hypothetical protein
VEIFAGTEKILDAAIAGFSPGFRGAFDIQRRQRHSSFYLHNFLIPA